MVSSYTGAHLLLECTFLPNSSSSEDVRLDGSVVGCELLHPEIEFHTHRFPTSRPS